MHPKFSVIFNDDPTVSGKEVGDEAVIHATPVLRPGIHIRMRQVCVSPMSVGSRLLADHEGKMAVDGAGRKIDGGMLPHREL
jgi:hypothetical protein